MRQFSIPESTLYRWTSDYRQSITIGGEKYYRSDIRGLLRELGQLKAENELLHKSKCSVQAPLSAKLPEMIRLKEETQCDVHTLCRAFEVLRSTYYHRVLRSPKKTQLQKEDDLLKPVIREIFDASKERFGSLMIKVKMQERGYQVSPKRIARLMREMDLVCNSSKRTLPDYKRAYHKSIYYTGNKLDRKFLQLAPNVVWVSDITYLRTLEGNYYLCVILDLFSRRVIGHTFSRTAEPDFLLSALEMAVDTRDFVPGLIFHSDQGAQYVSDLFREELKRLGITQSFSKPGNPYDNAVAESFFATLKKDQLYKTIYLTFTEVAAAVVEYIPI